MTADLTAEPYDLSLVHRLIEPGPVTLISTTDGDRPNLMTNGFNMPVVHGGLIAFGLGPWDHSYAALRRTGECVVAIPNADLVGRVVDVGNVSGADIDKWATFGFTPIPASQVAAPLVQECFANIECRVADDRLVDDHALWLVEPIAAWVDETRRGSGEFHHRGDGTFSTNAGTVDLKDRMVKWRHLTR